MIGRITTRGRNSGLKCLSTGSLPPFPSLSSQFFPKQRASSQATICRDLLSLYRSSGGTPSLPEVTQPRPQGFQGWSWRCPFAVEWIKIALILNILNRKVSIWIASYAGVFRGARISSLPQNYCSTEDNIPFPSLANHVVLSKVRKADLDLRVTR